ncbi:CBS domain-containing protein [Thermopirellula anaerolimosa]
MGRTKRLLCTACGFENLAGAEICLRCGLPLVHEENYAPRNALERSVLNDRIDSLPLRSPVCVAPETPVKEVLKAMVAQGTGCAIVVDPSDELLGIFTERDALIKVSEDLETRGDRPVAEFMTSPVQCLDTDDCLAFAVHRMDVGGYRHIPIRENGRLVGVVSTRELLRHFTEVLKDA